VELDIIFLNINFLLSIMKIGRLEIQGKVVLAPMCDVTKLPFRLLCKRYGAAIVYTEMIHAEAYLYDSKRTKKRAKILEEERPVGIQLVGSTIDSLKKAAIGIEKELRPDLIDINIGCPAYNVIKTGSGSALLKDTKRLAEIVKIMSSSLEVPFTCKIRILEKEKDTLLAVKMIEKSGAAALTVHGRTAKQGYSGKSDWNIIKKIKESLKIPVILNGDIIDEVSAKNAIDLTGCDAVMVGRAAIKNPFIIQRIDHFLKTGEKLMNSFSDRVDDFIEIVNLSKKYGYTEITPIKILAQNFTKGTIDGSVVRKELGEATAIEQIVEIMKKNRSLESYLK